MNCFAQTEKFLFMAEYLTKAEIQQMIDDAVKNSVRDGVVEGLEEWQSRYGLTAAHWVHLDADYQRSTTGSNLIFKMILTAIVSAILTVFVLGMNSIVDHKIDQKTGATIQERVRN